MRVSTRARAVVCGVAALALVATGCSNSDTKSGGSKNAAITVDGSEPENPLIPGNTNESGGIDVVRSLFSRLIRYAPKDAKPENEMAESIETKDSKVFTIKIKKGWKFHDGTEVKSKNFVDAWNWVAYGPNGVLNASFLDKIQGYPDVQPADPDGDGPLKAPTPKTDKMSGLKVVDDYTFEVTLSAPFAIFPLILGYVAFSPLPDSFFKDPKAFGDKPIGNGPFKFVSWKHKSEIKITRNDDYPLAKPKVKDVTFRLYQSLDTAYDDVKGNHIDFLRAVPSANLIGDKYKADMPNRTGQRAVGAIQTVTFPLYDARFKNPKFRQAISMAIDRKLITEKIFNKARVPATGWVSPAVDGYAPGACGEFCNYDPAKAKALFQESGFTGEMTFAYNVNGGHKDWIEAACNSINTALGAQVCKPKPYTEFSDFRKEINEKKMSGLFRTGWQQDYPSIQNYLTPLYRTGASSNDGSYSNKAFDDKLSAADSAPTVGEANKLYAEAEKMLATDMAVIPLWYYQSQYAYSTKVKNVQADTGGELDLMSIEAA